MAKFMTAARKITLARVAGIGAGAGLMHAVTKDLSVVCPIAGLALVGAAVIHRRMKDLPDDTEITAKDLAATAGQAAGEVALATAIASVAKQGYKAFRGDRVEVTDAPVVDAPVVDVEPVTPAV